MRKRFFLIGYILLALAFTGTAIVEIWHRSENTELKRSERTHNFGSALGFKMGFGSGFSVTRFYAESMRNGGYIDDIRGKYIKYPLGLLALSGVFFLGGYLAGSSSDEEKV
jgi:hypothetical protein